MSASGDALDIFIIATPTRRLGIVSDEIERVITGRRGLEKEGAAIAEARSGGRCLRLAEWLGLPAEGEDDSVLVIKGGEGGTVRLASFSGAMDIDRLRPESIAPVPEYVRRRQRPFVVWGFHPRPDGALMLITFQYLPREGSS